MSWNGNGVFTRVRNWVADKNNGIKIVASLHDQEDDNLASGIEACLTRNNESKPSADFRPNLDASYNLGSAALRWVRGFFSSAVRIYNGSTNYVDIQPATLTSPRTITLPDRSGNAVLDSTVNNFSDFQSFNEVATFNKRPIMAPIGTNSGDAGGVTFRELATNGNDGLTLKVEDAVTSYTLTLPGSQGSAGTTLTNDGLGNLSWQIPASVFGPVGSGSGDGGRIQLRELSANGTQVVRVKAADSIATSFDITLPASLPSVEGAGIAFSTAGVASFTASPVATRAISDESAFIFNLLSI